MIYARKSINFHEQEQYRSTYSLSNVEAMLVPGRRNLTSAWPAVFESPGATATGVRHTAQRSSG